jgi:hypothetical protein
MSGTVYPTTHPTAPEDLNLQQHFCENLKFRDRIALFQGLQYLPPRPSDNSSMRLTMEHWWNDIDSEKPNYFDKYL